MANTETSVKIDGTEEKAEVVVITIDQLTESANVQKVISDITKGIADESKASVKVALGIRTLKGICDENGIAKAETYTLIDNKFGIKKSQCNNLIATVEACCEVNGKGELTSKLKPEFEGKSMTALSVLAQIKDAEQRKAIAEASEGKTVETLKIEKDTANGKEKPAKAEKPSETRYILKLIPEHFDDLKKIIMSYAGEDCKLTKDELLSIILNGETDTASELVSPSK